MQFPRLTAVNLEPLWEEEINHKLALKHALLFASVEGVKTCIVEQNTLGMHLTILQSSHWTILSP
jgi:general secretion pathway protein E